MKGRLLADAVGGDLGVEVPGEVLRAERDWSQADLADRLEVSGRTLRRDVDRLRELGYQVDAFTFHDSPRRAHSIAAQGGINAAKNYQNDGDSVHRLFYDTLKGGDYRAREANVHRLAEVSVNIIDQCAALGVPFARE